MEMIFSTNKKLAEQSMRRLDASGKLGLSQLNIYMERKQNSPHEYVTYAGLRAMFAIRVQFGLKLYFQVCPGSSFTWKKGQIFSSSI